MQVATATAAAPVRAPYSVDTSAGSHDGSVSTQWCSRPADQKFADLTTLHDMKRNAFMNSWEQKSNSRKFELFAPEPKTKDDIHILRIGVPNVRAAGADIVRDAIVSPTHHAFGQIAALAKAPASYLRELPSPMVADQINYRLRYNREVSEVGLYGDTAQLLAATGPGYGRIPDYEIVAAVMRIAGNGLGEDGYHWKTPGRLNWSNGTYNPEDIGPVADRTFYGSDRDMFIFLVDDRRPIVVGKTRDGRDDHMFRGFYIQNSEVGSRSLKLSAFYLRGVCMNRNLWGCEGLEEIMIRHTATAPDRWIEQVRPALDAFSAASDTKLVEAVAKAKAAVLVESDDDALAYLQKRSGFSASMASKILDTHAKEEGAPARTVWDFAQGITAVARDHINTDTRLDMELAAKKLLDAVA